MAIVKIINQMLQNRLIALFKASVEGFLRDNCFHMAAAISYYTLFSIFPLILAVTSIAGFVLGSGNLEAQVVRWLSEILPDYPPLEENELKNYIIYLVESVIRNRSTTGLIGTSGLFIASMTVFAALRKSINLGWGILQPRPFFIEKFIDTGMMMGLGFLLFLSLAITAGLKIMRSLSLPVSHRYYLSAEPFWNSAGIVLSAVLTFITFMMLFKFIPNTRVHWRNIWPGALLAALGFEMVKNGFVYYVQHYANYHLVYGPVAMLVAMLTWTYISAIILLFGAELACAYPRIILRVGRLKENPMSEQEQRYSVPVFSPPSSPKGDKQL